MKNNKPYTDNERYLMYHTILRQEWAGIITSAKLLDRSIDAIRWQIQNIYRDVEAFSERGSYNRVKELFIEFCLEYGYSPNSDTTKPLFQQKKQPSCTV
jgi:hypothetical protein